MHPIKVPSCSPALEWAVQLQRDILTKLCDPATNADMVTPEWVAALRPDCSDWLKRFVQRTHHGCNLLSAIQTIEKASRAQKRAILEYFEKNQAFPEAFDPTVSSPTEVSPVQSLGADKIVSYLRTLLEAFYEIALRKGLPIDAQRNTGQGFNRNQFVETFKRENFGRVCPFCDGDMNGPEVDHWLPKSKYPALSCHPKNLVPVCHRCNSLECKGEKVPLDSTSQRPFENWFHPYERPAHENFSVQVNSSHVSLVNGDPVQQTRLENLDKLLKLTSRWAEEYKSQTNNYLRQLAGKVRRKKIKPTTEDVLEAIQEWLEDIEAEKTKMPHSIIRRVVLGRASDTASPDFDGWLQHATDVLQ